MSRLPHLGHVSVESMGMVGSVGVLRSDDHVLDSDPVEVRLSGHSVENEVRAERDGCSTGATASRFSPRDIRRHSPDYYVGSDNSVETVFPTKGTRLNLIPYYKTRRKEESRGGMAPSGGGLGVSPNLFPFPLSLARERGTQG